MYVEHYVWMRQLESTFTLKTNAIHSCGWGTHTCIKESDGGGDQKKRFFTRPRAGHNPSPHFLSKSAASPAFSSSMIGSQLSFTFVMALVSSSSPASLISE